MNTIRRAKKEDIPKILDLLTQVKKVHYNGRKDLFKESGTKFSDKELEDIIANNESPVFVCVTEEDIPIAHAFCIHKQVLDSAVLTDIKTLYIDDICVDEACRGSGAGKALYEYIHKYAEEAGFYNIVLNVWAFNEGAVKFYEAMGMKTQRIIMETIL